MRFLNYSAGLALYALLVAACQSTSPACDSSATTGLTACQSTMCTGTMRDCKNGTADGCETDSAIDVNNCGACGNKCPTPANGEAACIAGVCGVSNCGTRYRDCNTSASDGCEIDTLRDVNNCGACGNVCPGGTNAAAACIQGKCQLACQAKYLDCNGDPADGCETNGASDLFNCGNCGNQCAPAGTANIVCGGGSCVSTVCTGTNFTCKAGPINSCETDTATNVNNCGSCNMKCAAVANGTPGCANSNCGIGSCSTGFDDCDKALANGCEVNLTNDAKNCGTCANACGALANAVSGCAASKCGITSCNTNFGDCDKDAATGCEVNLTKDIKNCGTCGNACGAGLICYSSKCVPPNRVLLVYADNYGGEVEPKLTATGAFTVVDTFDARVGTPDLTMLQGYDVVMVWSQNSFFDTNAMGDVMADYFDGGGRVVVTTFANASLPLLGRWMSDNYHLIDPTGQEEPPEPMNMQIIDPNSPLVVGVSTLSADQGYRSTGGPINGGVVVATWGSGAPLIVTGTHGGRKLVALNFTPESHDTLPFLWIGDGTTIMVNALNY